MPLDASYSLSVAATLTNQLDFTTVSAPISRIYQQILTDGAGANQANRLFHDQRTLAASANEDLDLAGVLTDPFGATITFARIRGLVVAAAATNTNNVIVGGAAATQFSSWVGAATHTVIVRPGGFLALFAPDATAYAVGAGATDFLRIANSAAGTSVTYDIILLGSAT
jgi:hypothetical protein